MPTRSEHTGIVPSHIPSEILALLAALQMHNPSTEGLRQLDDAEWSSLLEVSEIAHLVLPLARLPMDGFPGWVVERLQRNLADNALRFERVKSTYREAAAALDKAGVEHIVIKGFTQAPDYVARPIFRDQTDIDFFCLPATIPDAQKALRAIGYESDDKTNNNFADHASALVRLSDWKWRGNRFDPDMPLGLELHFCLWNSAVSLLHIPETSHFWERRVTREVDGLTFRCLHPVDQAGHLALHILRNLFLTDWVVHHVRELAVLLHSRAADDAFWQTWAEMHSPLLRSREALAFYLARAWFGCRLHPKVEQAITDLPAIQLSWLRRFSGSALEVMFEQNKDHLWLHLALLSSPRDKWRILRSTLVPAQVVTMDSPFVRMRNKRSLAAGISHPRRQYLGYLLSRSSAHIRANIRALARGLRWYLSRNSGPAPRARFAATAPSTGIAESPSQ